MDHVANTLVHIKNCEIVGKKACEVPASKLISNVLKIMQNEGYIGGYEFEDDGKAGRYNIELLGKVNDCKAIKPRYSVKKDDFVNWEKRYLPSRNLGTLVVSTSKGIMTHRNAKKLDIGGKLVAYFY